MLLSAKRTARTTGSYVGENKEFERQFLSGELEVGLVPQGTLAERRRVGGAGIPAFFTPAGVGTQIAEGGLPLRYDATGSVELASPPKEVREFDGKWYVLEHGIQTDFALGHTRYGDRYGNLIYEESAQNFNTLCASAGRIAVAEVVASIQGGLARVQMTDLSLTPSELEWLITCHPGPRHAGRS